MSIHYRIVDDLVLIVGHTYPHKEAIKSIGGRFDRQQKVWVLPNTDDNKSEVDKLCQQLGGGPLAQVSSQPARPRPSV